jgi:hypothetical protein
MSFQNRNGKQPRRLKFEGQRELRLINYITFKDLSSQVNMLTIYLALDSLICML